LVSSRIRQTNIDKSELKKNKPLSRNKKILRVILIIGAIIGVIFFAVALGSMYIIVEGRHSIGWANLEVLYFNEEYQAKKFKANEILIDVYYAENNTKYKENLNLDDFPFYMSAPSLFFIRAKGEYEYKFVQLLGSPTEDEPYLNTVYLLKPADPSKIQLNIDVLNITYLDYSQQDPLNQILTEYQLGINNSETGIKEITNIICTDKDSIPDSSCFFFDIVGLSEKIEKHYVWIDKTGSSVDPNKTGRIGHRVDISGINTASEIASQIAGVINDTNYVSANSSGSVITIVNDNEGAVEDAKDVNTGFTIATVKDGSFPWHNSLNFGTCGAYITLNFTGITPPKFLGCGTYIPPDIFEDRKDKYPIAYRNDFNWKGLMMAFDAEINISLLQYSAEGYFLTSLNVYEINITQNPSPQKIWVVLLPDVSYGAELKYKFTVSANNQLKNIYIWSGWLDDYANPSLSFHFNQYQKI